MVDHIKKVVTDYDECLRRMHFVPKFSYGRGMLRKTVDPSGIVLPYTNDRVPIVIIFSLEFRAIFL
jgi:hypothetical protein